MRADDQDDIRGRQAMSGTRHSVIVAPSMAAARAWCAAHGAWAAVSSGRCIAAYGIESEAACAPPQGASAPSHHSGWGVAIRAPGHSAPDPTSVRLMRRGRAADMRPPVVARQRSDIRPARRRRRRTHATPRSGSRDLGRDELRASRDRHNPRVHIGGRRRTRLGREPGVSPADDAQENQGDSSAPPIRRQPAARLARRRAPGRGERPSKRDVERCRGPAGVARARRLSSRYSAPGGAAVSAPRPLRLGRPRREKSSPRQEVSRCRHPIPAALTAAPAAGAGLLCMPIAIRLG
jgi:hypothetical protein